MSDILIKNGYVITMNEDKETISRGDVAIDENRISAIGEDLEENAETVINAKNKVVLPGLVNAHTHISMVLFRGIADDLELQTWLGDKIWPLEQNLTEEYVLNGALLGCLEMIKSGATCFADQYFLMGKVAEAVKKSGLRANLSYGLIDEGDPKKREKELKKGEKLVKEFEGAAEERIRTMFGPHSTYTCSPECLKEVRDLAEKHGVGVHIHLSENNREIETVKDMYGKRPPEILDSADLLGPNTLAAHCTKVNKEEIQMLSKSGVNVAHNPVSNMKLASGIAPVPDLISNNVNVGLGTDGAASNNSLDMFEEIKFAALLSKVGKNDPTVVPAEKAIEMATLGGAKVLGIEDEVGSIERGKKADITLVDLDKPHFKPIHNVESHLAYNTHGGDVDTTIVDGNILMKENEIKSLDVRNIMEKCQKSAEELAREV